MSPEKNLLRVVLALLGLTAVIAQVVLMRELITVFHGNEISLGLMLASWMLWTAVGSTLPLSRLREPRVVTAVLEMLVAAAFPAALLAVRFSRTAFGALPGETLGPGPMLLTSLAALAPFCLASGGLFAAAARLYSEQARHDIAAATGTVYLLEAAGSAAGGVLASLALIRWLTPFQIAGLVAALNLIAAALVLQRRRTAITVLAFAPVLFPFAARSLETASLAQLWRGFHVLARRNSVYGSLAVVGGERSRSLYDNGLPLFTAPDEAAAEEAVHFALLQHPAPRTLLLIGGGANGSLGQALQHPTLRRVDYVELDPEVLRLARQYFPAAVPPSVRVHETDGRLYLKRTADSFDVIIVNLPDPQTAQLNRFYTLEFFREAARKLAPGGVFSFQARAAEDYLSPELAELLRCFSATLGRAFPRVAAIPGETAHFFGTDRTGTLAKTAPELIGRLRARRIQTVYVREYFLRFRLSPERLREFGEQIRPRPDTPLNRDFAPIACYLDNALWGSQFGRGWRNWFTAPPRVSFSVLAGGVALAALALALVFRSPRGAAAYCTAATGLTLIGLELLLLLAFQAMYGYVYQQLAILIAALMAGMAFGSWWALRGSSGTERALASLQAVAACAPLLLCLAAAAAPAFLYVPMALACGILGGRQFVVANRLYFKAGGSSPGALYGIDLAGSCLGAVALSAYVVPVFGFVKTAMALAIVNAAATLAALAARRVSAP